MDAAKKIFSIIAIVCSALALIGWIVFVGGYGYTTTQINPKFLNAETRAELVYPELGSDPIIDTDSKTYNANLTGVLPELGIGSAPFYLTAVLSPILIIIMIVAAILLLVIGQKTIVHLPFAIVIVIFLMIVIPSIGGALQLISATYQLFLITIWESVTESSRYEGYRFIVGLPTYFNAVLGGGVLEIIFLGLATIFLMLAYILRESDSYSKM